MKSWSARDIALIGLIAALYAVLTIVLSPISYLNIQFRVSEALTVLPFVYPPSIVGLYIGCLVANIFSPLGLPDIIFGPILTLIAGFLTYFTSKIRPEKFGMLLAPLPPVLINAFGVALIIHIILNIPYWAVVLTVGLGQFIWCYVFGLPFLYYMKKKEVSLPWYKKPVSHRI